MPPLPVTVPLSFSGLSPDTKTRIIREQAEASAERIKDAVNRLYDERMMAGILKMDPKDELVFFLKVTTAQDAGYLLEGGDYGENVMRGVWPMPEAPYWQQIMLVPFIATKEAHRFRDLYRRYIGEPGRRVA